LLAVGDAEHKIRLWQVGDGVVAQTLSGYRDAVMSIVFSADGRLLVSGGNWDDRTVRVWRVSGGTLVQSADIPSHIDTLAFTPDRQTLAIEADDEVFFWRVPS
jgi:WD40 repeat protein